MKILQNKAGGENRVALTDDQGRVISFAFQRDISLNEGDIVSARVVTFHPTLHGYFLETEKGSVFLPDATPLTEGQTITVRIKREARAGKEATAERTTEAPSPAPDKANVWAEMFKVGIDTISAADMDTLIAEAIIPDIYLDNGGELHIERTRIGWTIDVDSGRSRDDLTTVNKIAIVEVARQVILKNMAGLILIDLAGSKRGRIRPVLEKALQQAFAGDNRTTLSGWTPAGLFEIQRTRTTASLWDSHGEQLVAVYYQIVRDWYTCRMGHPMITAHPSVVALLTKHHPEIAVKPCFDKPVSFFEIREE